MEQSFEELTEKISEPMKSLQSSIEASMTNLIEENLIIPGLVGPGSSYKNMKVYLSQNHTKTTNALTEITHKINNIETTAKKDVSDS